LHPQTLANELQIFKSVGLAGQSAGLFATGIYGVVKITITALGLMLATEQVRRSLQPPLDLYDADSPQARKEMESNHRWPRASVRHVLHRHQPSRQSGRGWSVLERPQYLCHNLRLLIRCFLLFWMGTDSVRGKSYHTPSLVRLFQLTDLACGRVQSQPRTISE
jgi:hypothetical protein